jgi:hypothetical protein
LSSPGDTSEPDPGFLASRSATEPDVASFRSAGILRARGVLPTIQMDSEMFWPFFEVDGQIRALLGVGASG